MSRGFISCDDDLLVLELSSEFILRLFQLLSGYDVFINNIIHLSSQHLDFSKQLEAEVQEHKTVAAHGCKMNATM